MSIQHDPKYRLADALKERQKLNEEIQRLLKMAADNGAVSEMQDYLDSRGLLSEIGAEHRLREEDFTPEKVAAARAWFGI
jgi:hypothetical protein